MQYIQLQPQIASQIPTPATGSLNFFLDVDTNYIQTKGENGEIVTYSTITGGTYSDNTLTFSDNANGSFNITGVTTTILSPYKVFTGLLTQNGPSSQISVFQGDLSIGVTYLINLNNSDGADFTNVGAPNNNEGTYFIATGTTPNSWGINEGFLNGIQLIYDEGAPIVTILENTIGYIWFIYDGIGSYNAKSNELFTNVKTIPNIIPQMYQEGFSVYLSQSYPSDESTVVIETSNLATGKLDSIMNYAQNAIEIRVYNQ